MELGAGESSMRSFTDDDGGRRCLYLRRGAALGTLHGVDLPIIGKILKFV